MAKLKIPFEYRVLPGGHSFGVGVIQKALPIALEFLASHLQGVPASQPAAEAFAKDIRQAVGW